MGVVQVLDPASAAAYLARDPLLRLQVAAFGPPMLELRRATSVFGALAEAIVHQQLSTKAAATIHGRLCALFPARSADLRAEDLMTVDDATLRSVGLSRAKSAALRDLASRALDGTVPSLEATRGMPDGEILSRLTAVRGIGTWTAQMFLIFRLGRPDVLPLDDIGLQRGFCRLTGAGRDGLRAVIENHGRMWAPYRTAASWYLWRVAETSGL